jgi:2-dehydro-3-deoxyphosphogluconate aldolase/(4S)-4-hydroxy-2-oxoglutarate aldolase
MSTALRPSVESAAMIRAVGIIPVVRAASSDIAVRIAETLITAGIPVIEVTMTVPGALDAIATLVRRLGNAANGQRVLIGAGTVTDAETARRAVVAGAEFIVSPCLVPEVIAVAAEQNVAVIPGALTPTEIFQAVSAGAELVKVFPAESMGGPAYLQALRGPFPNLSLVPTGGVTLRTIAEYLRAGAAAVGVGGELVSRDALIRGDFNAIGGRAEQFVRAVAAVRTSAASS